MLHTHGWEEVNKLAAAALTKVFRYEHITSIHPYVCTYVGLCTYVVYNDEKVWNENLHKPL